MRRRQFIVLLGGMAGWPIASLAQAKKVPTIGVLVIGTESTPIPTLESFRQGLRDLGRIEGQNVRVDIRWTTAADRLPEMADELVRMNVDVIFATSSTFVEAARKATKTIPIVFAAHADPVGLGHVASLAHPGGNITGLSQLLTELAAKELEMLKEAVPQATRIGVLWNPTTPSHRPALNSVEVAASQLGVQVQMVPARSPEELDGAVSAIAKLRMGALLVVASPLSYVQRVQLAELALKYRLPGMFGFRENVRAGGLISYGADINDLFRRAAIYVDKILKGANPADMPVQQPTKFELVINLKTAKALGLTVPPMLLARADEVIE